MTTVCTLDLDYFIRFRQRSSTGRFLLNRLDCYTLPMFLSTDTCILQPVAVLVV